MNFQRKNDCITIIMPNYNGEKYIARAIESFLNESYENKRLIIVDGQSKDRSHLIIQEYVTNNNSIIWLKVEDCGISDAINKAIDYIQDGIVGYLGSDDLLSGDTLQTISYWQKFIDFDAIFFNSYTYYVEERRTVLQRPSTLEINTESLLMRGTIVGLQNVFFKRYLFDDLRFNIENKYSMDYELLLELAARDTKFAYIDKVATVNYFDGNISHNNEKQRLEAAYVARKFCGEYKGPLFGELLLPEVERRVISAEDSGVDADNRKIIDSEYQTDLKNNNNAIDLHEGKSEIKKRIASNMFNIKWKR